MNFIKATIEVLAEYGVLISTEITMPDGEYIKHLTHTPLPEVLDAMWEDTRLAVLTVEMVRELIPIEEV